MIVIVFAVLYAPYDSASALCLLPMSQQQEDEEEDS